MHKNKLVVAYEYSTLVKTSYADEIGIPHKAFDCLWKYPFLLLTPMRQYYVRKNFKRARSNKTQKLCRNNSDKRKYIFKNQEIFS